MSSNSQSKRLILVIGSTGAQGVAVVDALLAPSKDGSPSPWAVRAFTRNVNSATAQQLAAKGVELAQGSFDDFASVQAAMQGVYGVWANTDGFTVGEQKEIFAGMRIFEIAKQSGVKHYVWSNLDYVFKKSGYNPDHKCEHYDGKGRVAEWLKQQSSIVSDTELSWSVVTSGPYMDMIKFVMFGALNRRADGTVVFASPIGKGHVHMITLKDLGWWARYVFDHREATSAKDLEVASERVGWEYLRSTFEEVTGLKAVVVNQTVDEWMENFNGVDRPLAIERGREPDGSTSWRQNFSSFWRFWRDDVLTRDYEWIRSVHPETQSLAEWMRENNYKGQIDPGLLKNSRDGKLFPLNRERISLL